MSAETSATSATPPKQPHLLLLLTWSFLLFSGSFILDQAIRWTDTLEGIENGLIHLYPNGLGWLCFGLIPGLLANALWRRFQWRKFRTVAVLSPGIFATVMTIAALLFSPTTAATRLKRTIGADLPASAREVHTHFSGGGFADISDTYYFRCESADTEQLIQTLKLSPAKPLDIPSFYERPAGCPPPSTWPGDRSYYKHAVAGEIWFYYLITDAAKEQVYLLVGCI